MRILLTNFHLKDGGGHKTYINYLFEFLINIGIEVYLACPKSSQLNSLLKKKFPDRVFDVEFPSKPREIINLIRNIFLLKKIISSKKINLIHVNGSPDHKIVALSKWLFGKDFKIIRTKHDSFPIKKSLTNKKLYKKYTDQMIVVSDYQFRSVITDSSLKKKTVVIKNGVDINHFSPSKGSDALKIKLGISKNDFVLVSTAGTAHHKGWLFLAEAIETLDESLRNSIKVILLGNKPSDEILNKNYIKGFIFSGLVEDVRPYVAIADVGFVLSYKVETISYACREMMSMGKPVIVSNFSGLPENINNGINGWIVDAQNIRELRNKILEIINLKDIKAISVKARNKSIMEFNIKEKNECLVEIYSETLSYK